MATDRNLLSLRNPDSPGAHSPKNATGERRPVSPWTHSCAPGRDDRRGPLPESRERRKGEQRGTQELCVARPGDRESAVVESGVGLIDQASPRDLCPPSGRLLAEA